MKLAPSTIAATLALGLLAATPAAAAGPDAVPPATANAVPPDATPGADGDAAADSSAAQADVPAAASVAACETREQDLLARLEAHTLGPGFLTLDADDGPFLVRYEPAEEPPALGAVLVVPGPGTALPALGLLDALAAEFPPARLAVIAVQLPLLARSADLQDYATCEAAARGRLEAALARLKADGIANVAVLGIDDGAALVARALGAGLGDGSITAFAARGRWEGSVEALDLPRLELLPGRDPLARQHAAARQRASAGSDVPSRRREYPGATRGFAGYDDGVARDLRGWLHRLGDAG